MGSYGRNFEFRIVPTAHNRLARFATQTSGDYATVIPQGAPVQGTGSFDDLGREKVELADAATPPVKGRCGIGLYEHGDGATWAGDDPFLTTYSDKGTLPAAKAVQVVSGPNVKVVFKNTEDETFLQTREYEARTMVAGMSGATPTVAVGEYLEPHSSPSDSNGYWQETATADNAWLVITKVDSDRGEVEAQFLF